MPYAATTLPNGCTSWRAIASASDLRASESFSDALPMPTMADATAALTTDIQSWLDATAAQNGYDSLASCVSYKDSTIAQWQADAVAAIAWRDAVWQACFEWQQSAAAEPPSTFPTAEQVIAQLPQPDAYGWVVHEPGQVTP